MDYPVDNIISIDLQYINNNDIYYRIIDLQHIISNMDI